MITSQSTYWIYRDGAPVKRLYTRRATYEFAADLRVRYPGSTISARYTELREVELFTLAPIRDYIVKETFDV